MDETQKIFELQEEVIGLQKTSYNSTLEATRKIHTYKTIVMSLLIITLLTLTYAFVISLLYYVH
ncbi:hypothetical protein KW786_02340 [Candidatus Parcubacteria bacterium]|nr:hypothetical protein [Candidatus Parcubacteria bacterium]